MSNETCDAIAARPAGWKCSLPMNHAGPCAASPAASQVVSKGSNELESTERAVEVNLGEDDVLVVKSERAISNEKAERITAQLENILGKRGNQILIIGGDLELMVLHRELPAIKEQR